MIADFRRSALATAPAGLERARRGKEPTRPFRCASSQPHDKPIRVALQKAIIIKVVKTAPAPSLPRIGAILILRSRLIHCLFCLVLVIFLTGAVFLWELQGNGLLGFVQESGLSRRAIGSAAEHGNVRQRSRGEDRYARSSPASHSTASTHMSPPGLARDVTQIS